MQGAFQRIRHCRGVPVQQLLALSRGQHGQILDLLVWCSRDTLQQRPQVPHHPPDGRRVEEIGVVGDGAGEPMRLLEEVEDQVGFDAAEIVVEQAHLQTGQVQCGREREVVQVDNHLH